MIELKTKKELRCEALKRRKELHLLGVIHTKSKLICENIKNSSHFKKAKNIALYYPLGSEIDITDITKTKNKNFYLPRTKESNIEFAKYDNNLKKGEFNILVPESQKIDPEILDIIYIPALMANHKGYRLGWGKGCYDIFFKNNELIKAKKIIITLSDFVSEDFIEDKHDEKCDYIQTENYCKIC